MYATDYVKAADVADAAAKLAGQMMANYWLAAKPYCQP